MKYLVEALDTYEKYNVVDNELKRVPKKGEQWETTKERADILLGANDQKRKYIKIVTPEKKEIKKAIRPKKKVEKATKIK